MMKKIGLILFNETQNVSWNLGEKFSLEYSVDAFSHSRDKILSSQSDYLLFWSSEFTIPSEEDIEEVIKSPGNLWHVGPKLETNIALLDFVQPTSMLHVNSNLEKDHSSWKLSFKGCLMKKEVFAHVPLEGTYVSLDSLALDFGYKAVRSGVLTRYSVILSKNINSHKSNILKRDEFLFIQKNFDKKGFIWTYLNNLGKISPFQFYKLLRSKKSSTPIFNHKKKELNTNELQSKVSVVIATLNRYTVLLDELEELSKLDPKPSEVLIVDQTVESKKEPNFFEKIENLNINYIPSDKIGQCSARNLGVEQSMGDFIWFLDDDMKHFPKDYLKQHLETIFSYKADISCGVPHEIGTNETPRIQDRVYLSDGFPTNDVLVRKEVLQEVGGFDTKMDTLQSEDQEIGLRCVKNGALSLKNDSLKLTHLRAPQGGLRQHNVRKVTFSSSRNSLTQRRLLHFSEIYIAIKHFSKKQVKNYIRLNIRGTFVVRGNIIRKLAKAVVALVLLPSTMLSTNKRYKLARNLLNNK